MSGSFILSNWEEIKMNPVHYVIALFILYFLGVGASLVEKLSAYRFSIRYEDISRSRETKREVKEIRIKVRQEIPYSLVWPLELWRIYKRDGK